MKRKRTRKRKTSLKMASQTALERAQHSRDEQEHLFPSPSEPPHMVARGSPTCSLM